jgi:hypothetical protein
MLLSVTSAFPQSPTFVRTDYPSLGSDHLVGDFNGDGKLDLAGLWTKTAAILLGNGDGTFQARAEYPVASWNQAVAAGDFNRDGALDLMVTEHLTSRFGLRLPPLISTTTAGSISSSVTRSPATPLPASSGDRLP